MHRWFIVPQELKFVRIWIDISSQGTFVLTCLRSDSLSIALLTEWKNQSQNDVLFFNITSVYCTTWVPLVLKLENVSFMFSFPICVCDSLLGLKGRAGVGRWEPLSESDRLYHLWAARGRYSQTTCWRNPLPHLWEEHNFLSQVPSFWDSRQRQTGESKVPNRCL